jgi:hypothetical protein
MTIFVEIEKVILMKEIDLMMEREEAAAHLQ